MGGQTFYVGGSGGYNDVDIDKEIDMSEANINVSKVNIHVSKVSKFSAGARILRGP